MAKERVLITVKTYPTLSSRYIETVCTAGIREDGSWVRIYPVPFRRLEEIEKQYSKYEWFEFDLVQNKTKDRRPESFRLASTDSITPLGEKLSTADNWRSRRALILDKRRVSHNLHDLIKDAKDNKRSLATYKPSEITDFVVEPVEREWDLSKLATIRNQLAQPDLFEDNEWRKTFKVVAKLPYKFSYKFKDSSGTEHKVMILDWEIGALYWNCVKKCSEKEAIQKVKQKYFDEFTQRDLHFYLGTTLEFHGRAPNPWVIIGVAPFPKLDPSIPDQLTLL